MKKPGFNNIDNVVAKRIKDSVLSDGEVLVSGGAFEGVIDPLVESRIEAERAEIDSELAQIAGQSTTLAFRLNQSLVYSTFKLNKDANDIFTELQYKRADGTLYLKSILSGGTSPEYTTRTETEYETDGTTVKSTRVYTITYTDGKVVSEVLQ